MDPLPTTIVCCWKYTGHPPQGYAIEFFTTGPTAAEVEALKLHFTEVLENVAQWKLHWAAGRLLEYCAAEAEKNPKVAENMKTYCETATKEFETAIKEYPKKEGQWVALILTKSQKEAQKKAAGAAAGVQ